MIPHEEQEAQHDLRHQQPVGEERSTCHRAFRRAGPTGREWVRLDPVPYRQVPHRRWIALTDQFGRCGSPELIRVSLAVRRREAETGSARLAAPRGPSGRQRGPPMVSRTVEPGWVPLCEQTEAKAAPSDVVCCKPSSHPVVSGPRADRAYSASIGRRKVATFRSVERSELSYKALVGGSSPLPPTRNPRRNGRFPAIILGGFNFVFWSVPDFCPIGAHDPVDSLPGIQCPYIACRRDSLREAAAA